MNRLCLSAIIFVAVCCVSTMVSAQENYIINENATVTIVTIWVKAVDSSGEPVRNLKFEDFEVYENDKKVETSRACFEEISAPLVSSEVQEVTNAPASQVPRTRPKFVVFLDLYNTSSTDYLYIKPRLQEFFDRLQNRNTEVMIAALTPQGKLGIVSRYTQDLSRLQAILEQAKGTPGMDQGIEANEHQIVQLLEQLQPEETPTDSIDDLTRTNPTREMNNQILRASIRLAKGFGEQARVRSEFSLKALESFAAFLAKQSEDDHTVMIYVSGGIDSQPGRRYYELIDRVAEGRGFKSDSFVYALRSGASATQEKFDIYPLLQKSVGKLTRYNVTLYTINTRGMAMVTANTSMTNEFEVQESKYLPDLQEPLQQIADETGGLFFQNSRNFKSGLERVLKDLEHQYILCYQPDTDSLKSGYHHIKVVTKKPGVNLRYRKGYTN